MRLSDNLLIRFLVKIGEKWLWHLFDLEITVVEFVTILIGLRLILLIYIFHEEISPQTDGYYPVFPSKQIALFQFLERLEELKNFFKIKE